MAAKQKPGKKTSATQTKKQQSGRIRKLDYQNKKKVIRKAKPIPGSFRLLGRALSHIWRNKRLFATILLVYALLYVVLVKGLAANFQLGETKTEIEEAVGSELGSWGLASSLFSALVGTAGSTSGEAASVYQTVLLVTISLAVIWAMRQTFEGRENIKAKQAFYQGMYPLVPFILVGLVIVLQLIPALLGIMVYGIVSANGIAVGNIENALWLILLLMAIGASIFMISSSLFAGYIVTLPNMTPLAALRSAKKLVRFRRFIILRKVLFLPAVVLLVALLLFMPLVVWVPAVAEVLFLVFILLLLLVTHAYFYTLYREMM